MWDVFLFLLTWSSSRGNLLHQFLEIMLLPGFLPINTSLATLFVLSEELILWLSFNCLCSGFLSSILISPYTIYTPPHDLTWSRASSAICRWMNFKSQPRSASWALELLFLPSFPKYLLSFWSFHSVSIYWELAMYLALHINCHCTSSPGYSTETSGNLNLTDFSVSFMTVSASTHSPWLEMGVFFLTAPPLYIT